MAHEIDMSLGRPAFTFDAEEGGAWHGLGNPIPKEHAKDPRMIAKLCGAGYQVYKAQVMFKDSNGTEHAFDNRQVLVRNDTHAPLEVISETKYNITQPVEYFEAFRDQLAANDLVISSAGVLKGGRIVFVNAKLNRDFAIDVMGCDPSIAYLCLGGGYDTLLGHFGYLNSFRTVCWNTWSAAMAEHARGNTLYKATHASVFDPVAIKTAMGVYGKELKVRANVFNALAAAKADMKEVQDFFATLLDIDPADLNKTDVKTGKPVISTRSRNQLLILANQYTAGPGAQLKSARGTWYGALNAVTHFVDHLAGTRDTTNDGSGKSRFASAQFGNGARTKARALELVMDAAKVDRKMLIAA